MEKFRLEDAFSMLKEIDNEETKAGNLNESLITEAKGDSDDKEDDIDVRELSWDTDWELSDNDADVKEEEIEDEDDVVGKVILNCPICQSKIFKSDDELEFSESENLYNTDEECPFCQTVGGFKMCGRVIPFDEEEDDKEEDKAKEDIEDTAKDEVKDETDEEEVVIEEEEEVEESLSEACEDGFCKDGDLEDGKSINVVDEENESCNEAVEDEDANLPSSMEIPVGEFCNALDIPTSELEDACAEELANYISDSFGYCINSLEFEVDGDTIRVSDIDWDLSESCGAKKRQITNEAIDDDMSISDEIKDEVEDILDASEEEVQEEAGDSQVFNCAKDVMTAYQNANKWLDSVKEVLYTDIGCVFFSSYIHNLAHTMPVRFDNFGDILHTVNMKIPYPSTQEIVEEPHTVPEALSATFEALDAIKKALNEFIKCTEDEYHGMSCAAETLLNDIEGEYPMLYRMQRAYDSCDGDLVKFDKWVNQYVNNKDNLAESLNEGWREDLRRANADRVRTWKGKIICVDELGDESEAQDLKYTGDEDGWEIYKNRKIRRLEPEYPECRFYVEDRTNWNSMINSEMGYNNFEHILDLILDGELSEEEQYSEEEIAQRLIQFGAESEDDILDMIDVIRQYGYTVLKSTNESLNEAGGALEGNTNFNSTTNADNINKAEVGKLKAGNLKQTQGNDATRVKALQQSLNNVGINCPVTGVYDDATTNAVKEFQQKYGLTVDGIFGNQTANALSQVLSGKAVKSSSTPASTEKLEQSDTHSAQAGGGENSSSTAKISDTSAKALASLDDIKQSSTVTTVSRKIKGNTTGVNSTVDATKMEKGKAIYDKVPALRNGYNSLSSEEKKLYDYYKNNSRAYKKQQQAQKQQANRQQVAANSKNDVNWQEVYNSWISAGKTKEEATKLTNDQLGTTTSN